MYGKTIKAWNDKNSCIIDQQLTFGRRGLNRGVCENEKIYITFGLSNSHVAYLSGAMRGVSAYV